jgi:hypothetical protein
MSEPGFDQTRQPQYTQQGYQQYPVGQQNNSAEYFQGQKYRDKSLIFGVIGFFFLGIIFGPLDISSASKAEALHHSATPGKVLGWIATIVSSLWLIFVIIIAISAIISGAGPDS